MSALIPTPVSLTLEAEIMTDADTGRPNLIAAVDGDTWQETTPDKLRACAQRIREQLAAVERMAAQFEAIEALRALADSLGADLVEGSARLPHDAIAWYAEVRGRMTVIFTAGLSVAVQLQALHQLAAHLAVTA